MTEPLTYGAIVDVVAPASRCDTRELRKGIKELEDLGLRPRIPKDLFGGESTLFAQSDEVRLRHLRHAFYSEDSQMIWCVRGGYGAIRLMDQVRRWKKPKRAKIFLGYSDITSLNTHLNQEWGWPTLHGPMLDRLGRGTMAAGEKRELLNMIFAHKVYTDFSGLKPMNAAAKRARTIRSFVVGGNMAVLQSALGTRSAFRPAGSIIFLEDTGERPHRVDRMLAQFSQAGIFERTKALVLGHFQLHDAKDRKVLWNEVLQSFADQADFPVLRGLPVGHDPKRQYPLPLGTHARLQLGAAPSLRVASGIGFGWEPVPL